MIAFTDIANFIKGSAPFLAKALSSLSPAAGIAFNILTSALGVGSNPDEVMQYLKTNPDALVKIKQIELEHEENLQKIISYNYQIEVDDRKSARDKGKDATGKYDWFIHLISMLITIGFFSCIITSFFLKDNGTDTHVLNMMLGALGTTWTQMMSFYFGSSFVNNVK